MTTSGTINVSEWYNEWQQMTTNDTEWRRITTKDNKWKQITMTASSAANANKWEQVNHSDFKFENETKC